MLLALKINISPLHLFLCEKLREIKLLTWVFPTCLHPVISSPNQIWDFSCSPSPSHSRMSVYVGTTMLGSQAETPVSCNPSLLSPVITKLATIPKLFALKAHPLMSFQLFIFSLSSSLTWIWKSSLFISTSNEIACLDWEWGLSRSCYAVCLCLPMAKELKVQDRQRGHVQKGILPKGGQC